MPSANAEMSAGVHALRAEICRFILEERLQPKLDALKEDDHEGRARLVAQYQPEAWLHDAARRAGQIRLATHTLKPVHPDARGSNHYLGAEAVTAGDAVDTASLSAGRVDDVVGNAAALDVFKFLKLQVNQRSVMKRLQDGDDALLQALSSDPEEAAALAEAFRSVALAEGRPTSDTRLRQVYFPLPDGGYHLLAPLYPTSLAHALWQRLQQAWFGEAAKAARDARRKNQWHDHAVRDFPDIAVMRFGGTKPQNISQLNSERRGESYLLCSLPPLWQGGRVRLPRRASVFAPGEVFASRPRVRAVLRELGAFLRGHADRNTVDIRQQREAYELDLLDELVAFSAEMHSQPPGWSEGLALDVHQAAWLDPRGWDDNGRPPGWAEAVADDYARWLGGRLRKMKLAVGDDEATHHAGQALAVVAEVGND